MWRSGVRFFSSRVPAQQRPTKVIENLLKEHGPQTVNDCWKLAEPAGIKSKTHMKTMLHWLVERDRVKISCNHLNPTGQKKAAQKQKRGGRQQKSGQGFKEFLFGIRPKRVRKEESGEAPPDSEELVVAPPDQQEVESVEERSSTDLLEEPQPQPRVIS